MGIRNNRTRTEGPCRAAELEAIVEDLWVQVEHLRQACGSCSYADIGRRIGRARQTVTDWFNKRSVVLEWEEFQRLIQAIDSNEQPARWLPRWRHARCAQEELRSVRAKGLHADRPAGQAEPSPPAPGQEPVSTGVRTKPGTSTDNVRVNATSVVKVRNALLAVVIGTGSSIQVGRVDHADPGAGRLGRAGRRKKVLLLVAIVVAIFVALSPGQSPATSTPPAGHVLFSDEFTTNSGWMMFVNDKPAAPTIDGTLRIDAQPGFGVAGVSSKVLDLHLVDSILAVDILQRTGRGEYGATCRSYGTAGYKFAIKDTGYVGIFKAREDSTEAIPLANWRPTAALRPASVNHLVMKCRNIGDTVELQLWANGRLVSTATDSTDPVLRGITALYARASNTEKLSVQFDNVTVQGPI